MRTPTVETSYQVSPRVTLTPGDRFRVAEIGRAHV